MDYKCKFCNKDYKSYQSLWNHTKKFHSHTDEKNVKYSKNNNIKITKQKNGKYNCCNCKEQFINLIELDHHIKTKCKPDIRHNNIFKFKTDTFGKNKYPNDKGGDIYIIQTEFNLKNYYKIGITTNLYKRLADYRCGAVLEPRVHCYFPIKNIKDSDKILQQKLIKYNIKREIYKIDNLDDVIKIIKNIQKQMNSEEIINYPEIKECNIVTCNYCNDIFTNTYELSIHLFECKQKKTLINICTYCNKILCDNHSRWRHEKICKVKLNKIEENIYKNKIIELEKKLQKLEKKHVNAIDNKTNMIIKKSKKDLFDEILFNHMNKLESINKNINYKDFNITYDKLKAFVYLKKGKKEFFNQINMLSYNKKNMIIKTWEKLIDDTTINPNEVSDKFENEVKQITEQPEDSDIDSDMNSDMNSDSESDSDSDSDQPKILFRQKKSIKTDPTDIIV